MIPLCYAVFLLVLMKFYTYLPPPLQYPLPPKNTTEQYNYSLKWFFKKEGHKGENILFKIHGEGNFVFINYIVLTITRYF